MLKLTEMKICEPDTKLTYEQSQKIYADYLEAMRKRDRSFRTGMLASGLTVGSTVALVLVLLEGYTLSTAALWGFVAMCIWIAAMRTGWRAAKDIVEVHTKLD